jgi:hypothetical protein
VDPVRVEDRVGHEQGRPLPSPPERLDRVPDEVAIARSEICDRRTELAAVEVRRGDGLRPCGLRPRHHRDPRRPERTRLTTEWLFPQATLDAPGFRVADVVEFAATVLREDGEACEMNQRGLRSDPYRAGPLMPQKCEIHCFHEWRRTRLPGLDALHGRGA